MNVQAQDRKLAKPGNASRLAIADCDIHPMRKSPKDLYPFLERRWQEHLEIFGSRQRQGFDEATSYPKSQRNAARRDAWPPSGTKPGSDLGFMREQLLDACGTQFGVLNPVGDNGQPSQNQEFGAAYCRAMNDWQIAAFTSQEPRLKGSVVVPYENAPAAVEEIERRAGDENFVQILLQSRSAEPFGQRRYWPIFEAAERANLPVGVHAFGYGGYPPTGGGWPSFYIEDMVGHAQSCIGLLTSMVVEGVFERFPRLRLVLIESGFGWLPSLAWRLDKLWDRLKIETPHLKRLPSEYIHDHVWLTTQPMQEPETREHLLDTIEWIGWDRLMFATDYPHWDYDDQDHVLPLRVSEENRRKFFLTNALKLYGQE